MRRFAFLFLSGWTLGWIAGCGLTDADGSDPASPGFGTIAGEARLEGRSDPRSIGINVVAVRGDTTVTIHPDSTGRYWVSDLPSGIYAIHAERYGYIPMDGVGVEVKEGTIHRFDILLRKTKPSLRIDTWTVQVFYAKLGIFMANSVALAFRYHFEGLDGGIRNVQVLGAGLESEPFFRLSHAGVQDELSLESIVRAGYDSTRIWPVGTQLVVDAYIRGSYFVEMDFEPAGAIPFEVLLSDTVTVEPGEISVVDDAADKKRP